MSGTNEQPREWEVHASGRTNLADKRIPVYFNEGGVPFFIMHSTRYDFPLRYEEKDDGTITYTNGSSETYSQEWYDARFYNATSPPRSILALYHKNSAGDVTMRDGYLITPDHPLDRSLQPAVAAAAYAAAVDSIAQDTVPDDENITLGSHFPYMTESEVYKYYKKALASGVDNQADMLAFIERQGTRARGGAPPPVANDDDDDDTITIPTASADAPAPTPLPIVSASPEPLLLLPSPQDKPDSRPIIGNISNTAVVGPYHFNQPANTTTHSLAIYDARRSQLMSGLRLAPVEEPDYSDDDSTPTKTQVAPQAPVGQIVGLYL